MDALALLLTTLNSFISIYTVLLIIRILLTWFPTVDWYKQPFALLSQLTDPYLNLFRSIIPPLGGIDFSPILGFLALNLVQSVVLPSIAQAIAGVVLAYPAA
ncbi:YggT family protein [Myxacorys almedinensis]|uniref:YggT family protein n=1 Tax=Myxacorys almedinensis A TaxID=2690445 RepID=A0A8J8CLL6_9CYAN|nr:YggT family protein [Myxacorys almedinensis]NDJ16247.1 YggT family protein [Myxacorys almedinensis A]